MKPRLDESNYFCMGNPIPATRDPSSLQTYKKTEKCSETHRQVEVTPQEQNHAA